MMTDVKIIITARDGTILSDKNEFKSYAFDSEMGLVSSAFNLVLVNARTDIALGCGVQFLINGKIQFRGIIQRRRIVSSKARREVQLSGKDRASVLVEGYCNDYKDFNNESPIDIIDTLIGQTNFYTKPKGAAATSTDTTGFNNNADITSRNTALLADVNNSDTMSTRTDTTTYDAEFTALADKKHYKIDIGDTVFDKVSALVKSSGFETLYQENGTLYIGDLNKKRFADTVVYSITNRKDGVGNNVLSSGLTEDVSGRYSTISISSQVEDVWGDVHVNKEVVATDSTLDDKKFFAQHINSDEGDPEKIAIMTREEQRIAGYQLEYEVKGHVADSGQVWSVNRYVNVYDEISEVYRHLVLYGRTFTFDARGPITVLRLSHEKLFELGI